MTAALKVGQDNVIAVKVDNRHNADPAWPSPGGQWHPEEYQSLLHENAWRQLSARPYIGGTFMWVMFDFASDGRNEGAQPGINDKGLMTRDRAIRTDAFDFYQANWSSSAVVHLTSKRWTSRTTTQAIVKVYANRGVPAASLNGVILGSPQSLGANTYQWNVTLRSGANAVSVTAGGITDSATWTVRWPYRYWISAGSKSQWIPSAPDPFLLGSLPLSFPIYF